MDKSHISVGALVRWAEEQWNRYVPRYVVRMGIVVELCTWDAWEYRTLIVLAFNGEEVILFDDDPTLEIINENR